MEKHTYKIVFQGKIGHSQVLAIVKERLMEMFGLERDRIEQLFCGSRLIVKKNLSMESALKYKERFEQSGALCDIEIQGDGGLRMENPDLTEPPPKAAANTTAVPETIHAEPLTSSLVSDFTENAFKPLKDIGKAPGEAEDAFKFLSFRNIYGALMAVIAYHVVYAICDILGFKAKLFGFEVRQIIAVWIALTCWGLGSAWVERLERKHGKEYLILRVVVVTSVVVLMISGFWTSMKRDEKPQKQVVIESITKTKLGKLQGAMNAIQAAAMQEIAPFPETREQVLETIRTHKQLFPGDIRMMGPDLFKDEWGTIMNYEHQGYMTYTITSAGPDKTFGTDDDLAVTNKESGPS